MKYIIPTFRDSLHLENVDDTRVCGKYQIPSLRKEYHCPTRLIDFSASLKSKDYGAGVHFYLDDYRFERIWKEPLRYIPILKRFDCVFTPDFSLYMDMPFAMKIWNTYRSRLIGQLLQDAGCRVIPTISWAEPETYEFCFDGVEPDGVISISTVGIMRCGDSLKVFAQGLSEMIDAINPSDILVYGGLPKVNWNGIRVINFANSSFDWKTTDSHVNYQER